MVVLAAVLLMRACTRPTARRGLYNLEKPAVRCNDVIKSFKMQFARSLRPQLGQALAGVAICHHESKYVYYWSS